MAEARGRRRSPQQPKDKVGGAEEPRARGHSTGSAGKLLVSLKSYSILASTSLQYSGWKYCWFRYKANVNPILLVLVCHACKYVYT